MTFNVDTEFFAYICFEALNAARYELTAALVFFGAWFIGVQFKKKQKSRFHLHSKQHGSKALQFSSYQGEKQSARARPMKGGLDANNPKTLKDAARVIPQIVQLCQSHVADAVQLFRSAVKAGLTLQGVPADDCHQLCAALVAATIRTGKLDEAMQLLTELKQCGLIVNTSLIASVVKLSTSRQLYAECVAFFDLMAKDLTFTLTDKSVWSCLLFCSVESKAYQRCAAFFERVKACGEPSSKDFGHMLRIAALRGDWESSLSLLQEMRDLNIEIDSMRYNVTLATLASASKLDEACALLDAMEGVAGVADAITYNTLIKGYAKKAQVDKCFELFERMRAKDIVASQVTYGILLDCCINESQVDRATQVVDQMTAVGCQMNTVLYTTLIKGFARIGDLGKATDMYKRMRAEPNILPDLITFSILIKANCDNDQLEEALKLLEEMAALGLKPDEVVFNNLINGCARHGKAMLGKHLYEDMIKSGVRPSNATFSILIRLFHQCKLLDEAVTMLKEESAKHNVDLEARLFLQLIQSCLRERQGNRAIDVYKMLCEKTTPNVATTKAVISSCVRLNLFDTAAEVISIAVASDARVDVADIQALLEASFKKRKVRVVQSCIESMNTLGHTVDRKFIPVDSDPVPANLAAGGSWRASEPMAAKLKAPVGAC